MNQLGGFIADVERVGQGVRRRDDPQIPVSNPNRSRSGAQSSLPGNSQFLSLRDQEMRRIQGQEFRGMNAYDRHQQLISDYINYYSHGKPLKLPETKVVTDLDVLKQEHRFVRDVDEDAKSNDWAKRMALKYYQKLYKEYVLADMSKYKQGMMGFRWRTEPEVIKGKGQFICGNKKCNEREGLRSFEVNFGYVEAGQKKNTLVKLRVCPLCAYKLNYRKIKAMAKEEKLKKQISKEQRRLEKELTKLRAKAAKDSERDAKAAESKASADSTPSSAPPPSASSSSSSSSSSSFSSGPSSSNKRSRPASSDSASKDPQSNSKSTRSSATEDSSSRRFHKRSSRSKSDSDSDEGDSGSDDSDKASESDSASDSEDEDASRRERYRQRKIRQVRHYLPPSESEAQQQAEAAAAVGTSGSEGGARDKEREEEETFQGLFM